MKGGSKAKESESSKVQAEIGKKEWERYKTDFAPEEKQFISDVQEIGSGRERELLEGRGISELRQSTGPLQPSRSPMGIARRSLSTAEGGADISADTATKAIERKGRGINTAVGLGRSVATGAMGQLSRSSQLETSRNIAKAQADSTREQGLWDTIGTAAGYGIQHHYKTKGDKS
jgi:hypothetical protein